MPTIEIDFDVYCSWCGAGLCDRTTIETPRRSAKNPMVNIEPCEKCLYEARQEGLEDGKKRGYNEARNE